MKPRQRIARRSHCRRAAAFSAIIALYLPSLCFGEGPRGFIDQRGSSSEGPSRRKTILLSALVPGLGQFLHGERKSGAIMMAGEAASWASFATFRVQGSRREDRYVDYAERFAGVDDANGQDNDYYGFLAAYDHSGEPGGPDSYNEVEVRQLARDELFPEDPAAQEAYIRENSIDGSLAWDWESDARRQEYAAIRIASENAFHRSEYAVGAMVAGRIISVMHAIWLTAETEEKEEEGAALEPTATPFVDANLRRGEGRLGLCLRF